VEDREAVAEVLEVDEADEADEEAEAEADEAEADEGASADVEEVLEEEGGAEALRTLSWAALLAVGRLLLRRFVHFSFVHFSFVCFSVLASVCSVVLLVLPTPLLVVRLACSLRGHWLLGYGLLARRCASEGGR